MGMNMSSAARAEAELRKAYIPNATSVVNATAEARPLTIRELAMSAARYNSHSDSVNFKMAETAIAQGFIDMLRVILDSPDLAVFGPKIIHTLQHCHRLTSLEFLCDQLPWSPHMAFLGIQLEAIPTPSPGLQYFRLATTHGQPIPFSFIGDMMIRCPGLRALKLEGPSLSIYESYEPFIQSALKYLVMRYCELSPSALRSILTKSGNTLTSLHIEYCTGLEKADLATILGTCLPNLSHLTIIVPPHAMINRMHIDLHCVMDAALLQPMPQLVYLHISGMVISDEGLLIQANSKGMISSPMPELQTLIAHDDTKLTCKGLTMAIAEGRLPSLVMVEVLWHVESIIPVELGLLLRALTDRQIEMTMPMRFTYRDILAYLDQNPDIVPPVHSTISPFVDTPFMSPANIPMTPFREPITDPLFDEIHPYYRNYRHRHRRHRRHSRRRY